MEEFYQAIEEKSFDIVWSALYHISKKSETIGMSEGDHTWLADNPDVDFQEMRDLGRNNPLAHVLSRYLGSPRPIVVDLRLRFGEDKSNDEMRANQGLRLKRGDRVLLCSDGLTDMLDDDRIEELVSGETLADTARGLVESALAAGGHDNVSLILIQIP